jgi:ATP-dependent Clp protease ATP-binding subunit ClpC
MGTRRATKAVPRVFERYVPSARRAIFFARWHALQCGAQAIAPEHLLLGMIHEENTLVRSFLRLEWTPWLKNEIEQRMQVREALPKDTEIPLDQACKRILAYTVEEANSMSHKHIGMEHLLLGLLREKPPATEELLKQKEISLEKVRNVLWAWPADEFSLG